MSTKTLVWGDATAIANQVRTITEVTPEINNRQLITYRNRNSNSQLMGTTREFLSVRSFEVAKGQFISELDLK
ncbi:ABC transporter permease [Moorena sp. SIO4G3]|uniref:ABC transporter permease n=1 Tax=Moorena sp. SIO4G3 TaxID=2607821 RepID=UPI00142BEFDF|nr:ABC transporter permease [Moorena sp. SIO4G3]NEO80472.1 ABC transporter permease [Moorena sp. SIO4G3]